MEKFFKGVSLSSVQGDLVGQKADAIVNPANSLGLMNGGVALAIKNAVGPQIEEDAVKCAPIQVGSGVVPTSTRSKIPARLVLHASVMEQPGQRTTPKIVDLSVRSTLIEATALNLSSIAFPAMGAGEGRLELSEATRTIVFGVKYYLSKHKTSLKKIVFVAFDSEALKHFDHAIGQI
ncbi:macro domain-containing protein [Candidatus Micrarchaeota archaeon]|nr:macro domain-containing protein [Candidatus Micrarchaeota archaeon]